LAGQSQSSSEASPTPTTTSAEKPKTCGGYCCERFQIPNRNYGWYENEEKTYSLEGLKRIVGDGTTCRPEDKQILEMVIYLGYSDVNGNGDRDPTKSHWFTCKNFDTVTRLCKIYETRPIMCRSYNESCRQACGYTKCQMPKPVIPKEEFVGKKKYEEEIEEKFFEEPEDRWQVVKLRPGAIKEPGPRTS
jgi:Fe-S-cluster containining protein